MIKSFICSTLVLLLVIAIQACSAKPPEQHLNFTEVEVIVDDENDLTMFMITGEDFLFESPLEVTLGEFDPLIIISATDTQIDATLPFVIMPGDYVLTVSTGEGQSHGGDDLTIGAAGPQGERGEQGNPGKQGDPGKQAPSRIQGDSGGPSSSHAPSVSHMILIRRRCINPHTWDLKHNRRGRCIPIQHTIH